MPTPFSSNVTQPYIFQSVSGEMVNVKNTFLDGWDDEVNEERLAARRALRTCPDFLGRAGLESTDDGDMLDPSPQLSLLSGGHGVSASPKASCVLSLSDHLLLPQSQESPGPEHDGNPFCLTPAAGVTRISVVSETPAERADDAEAGAPRRRPRGGRKARKASEAATEASNHRTPAARRSYAEAAVDTAAATPWFQTAPAGLRQSAASNSTTTARKQQLEKQPHRSPPVSSGAARTGHGATKLWCHLYLDERMLMGGFELAKKIIGHGGSGTRSIFDATGAKIRLRGRGSQHLEGGREAPVHLMLAVTTGIKETDSFKTAVRMASRHLEGVERKFHNFCKQRGEDLPTPGSCFWVGEISEGGKAFIGEAACTTAGGLALSRAAFAGA